MTHEKAERLTSMEAVIALLIAALLATSLRKSSWRKRTLSIEDNRSPSRRNALELSSR